MVFKAFGKIGSTLLRTFGGPQGAAVAPFVGPIVNTLGDLFGSFGGSGGGNARDGGAAALEQTQTGGSRLNVLRVGQQVPSPVGTIRYSPPILPTWAEPDEFGRELVINILAPIPGPVKLEDIEINDTPIGSFDADIITSEVREGQDNDAARTLITQSVFEDIKNLLLPNFLIEPGSSRNLATNSNESLSKPVVVASRKQAGEIRLLFEMPSFYRTTGNNIGSTMLRMRMRKKGDTEWRTLPAFSIRNSITQTWWFQVVFKFEADPGGLQGMDLGEFFVPATIFNRWHTSSNFTNWWLADDYFGPKEAAGSLTTVSLTEHYNASPDTLTFYLDPADPTNPWVNDGPWEFEIRRGWGGSALFTQNRMRYFMIANSGGTFVIDDNNQRDIQEQSEIRLRSVLTVVDTPPIAAGNYGSIALKVRNLLVEKLSVIGSPYMNVWNGTDWNTVDITSNPAAYIRRARTDKFLAYLVPDALRGDDQLAAFWDFCVANGLTINTIIENNMTIDQFVQLCAEAGYSKAYFGTKYGIWTDGDRSADEIAGILTPHNARSFEISRPFDDVPQAIISPWRDSTDDYRDGEEPITYRTGFDANTLNLRRLQVTAPGKVVEADVIEWQQRKLDEYENRVLRFRAELDWEQMQFVNGDLVGIAWHTLSLTYGSGIVKSVTMSGDDVTGLVLHGKLPVAAAAAAGNVGLGIRYSDGTIVYHQITNTTDSDTITFTTPFPLPVANPPFWGNQNIYAMDNIYTGLLKPGVLVWSGVLGAEERRVLIENIEPAENVGAVMTMIDEAPSIHP